VGGTTTNLRGVHAGDWGGGWFDGVVAVYAGGGGRGELFGIGVLVVTGVSGGLWCGVWGWAIGWECRVNMWWSDGREYYYGDGIGVRIGRIQCYYEI